MDDTKRKRVNVIPQCYKNLVIAAGKLFYGQLTSEVVVLKALVSLECIEKHELAKTLELDINTLHHSLMNLNYDRLICERVFYEHNDIGKRKDVSYYFINYKSLSDVIKWKLLRVREAIKAHTITPKPFFNCSSVSCNMTFEETEARELFNPSKNNYFCTKCHCPVEARERNDTPEDDDGISMEYFNTKTLHFDDLFKECDMYKLAEKLLLPEINHVSSEPNVFLA